MLTFRGRSCRPALRPTGVRPGATGATGATQVPGDGGSLPDALASYGRGCIENRTLPLHQHGAETPSSTSGASRSRLAQVAPVDSGTRQRRLPKMVDVMIAMCPTLHLLHFPDFMLAGNLDCHCIDFSLFLYGQNTAAALSTFVPTRYYKLVVIA
ncbi:hypothetical protein E4U43_000589 [Claviceps pusilla]|uniref:Uncharacterized protein n=1 Tax=Claviceps pusilla TaxID=123648 RepID=A0A9P7N9J3_9HYPO|nr:hypothetical protein E4U43_000589 [Claviceps pusilla]